VGFEDLFTIADVSIQKTIEYNLKQLFPYAKVIGEEDMENLEGIEPSLQPDEIIKDLVHE
jgi:fructose-1,6-bisphosphatase/inositol monophosphatase family enzyme